MSTRTEEVRTVFTWDTSDADKGVKRLETAMDRLQQAERGAQRKASGHGGAAGGNFAMGIRDLAEGRGVNAMQRFGHTIGATALRLGAYMMAMRAAGEATRHLREELDKTDSSARRMEAAAVASNRSFIGSSSAEGAGSLSAKITEARSNIASEDQLQVDAQRASDHLKHATDNPWNPAGVVYGAATHAWRTFSGQRSPEEEQAASEARKKLNTANMSRFKMMRGEGYQSTADLAGMHGPEGNPYDAKRRELAVQKELELSQAKINELTDEDVANVERRYALLSKSVHAEERIAQMKRYYSQDQAAIRGGAESSFGKSLSLAADSIGHSRSLIDSKNLNQEQVKDELVNIENQKVASRSAIMGRYLNPDGSRRRAGAINRDFRRDRREERLRNRFLSQYEKGGFDPNTGRRTATGDAAGSGMSSHGESWKDIFRKEPMIQGATGGLQGGKLAGRSFDDIFEILRERLPPGK